MAKTAKKAAHKTTKAKAVSRRIPPKKAASKTGKKYYPAPKKAKAAAAPKAAATKPAEHKAEAPKATTHKHPVKKATHKSPAHRAKKLNKLGVKNSLVNNINAKKEAGTSKPKSAKTVSKKSYKEMKRGWK